MLDVAVPADVRRGGEPAHGHGMGLSTLQNFGLGLALEVHVAPELGMPVDLLTAAMRFSHRGHSPGYLARKQPLLSALGLLRSSAHADASSSWWRRSLALLRPLLCLLVLLFLVVLLFLLMVPISPGQRFIGGVLPGQTV